MVVALWYRSSGWLEGLRLLRDRDYDAAQLAFSSAARLFDEAREKTWEERVRDTSLTANRQ